MRQPATGSVSRGARWMTTKFIEWYWPRLHARAFVLSRAHEYQADRLAAAIASAPRWRSALWRLECLTPWLSDRFSARPLWRGRLFARATGNTGPDGLSLSRPAAPDDAARWNRTV